MQTTCKWDGFSYDLRRRFDERESAMPDGPLMPGEETG